MIFKYFLYFSLFLLVGCSDTNDLGSSREFKFNYQIDLEQSDDLVEVWFPVPQTNEVQSIYNETLSHGDLVCEKLNESIHGNHYYYCKSDNGLKESVTILYTCHVIRKEHGMVNYSNLIKNNYDKGTNHITVPEGEIFENIIIENNLSENNMRAVYDYVLNGMHYGKPKSKDSQYYKDPWLSENGRYGKKEVTRDEVVSFYEKAKDEGGNYTFGNGNSIYACDIGVGNCTDYHSYFMSLSRTMDVPARFHMGFSIPIGVSGKIGGYHCWADYYIDGEGWYPVDISEADKNPDKKDYFFGTVNYNRVEFSTGRDLELYNYKKHINFFIYPLVEGTSFTKSFNYTNI